MIIILLVNRQEYFKRKDIEKKAKKFQARQENQANAATDESKYDTSTKAYALVLFYLKTFREKNGSIVIRQEGAVLHFTGCEEGTTREDLKVSTCTCTSFKTCCICCHVDGGVEWSCFAFFVSLSQKKEFCFFVSCIVSCISGICFLRRLLFSGILSTILNRCLGGFSKRRHRSTNPSPKRHCH